MGWDYYRNGETKGEIKARIDREIEERRKKGETFYQVEVSSRSGMPAKSFWGRAWCENLESYRDYENRLPRGRTYLRQGNVYDLFIEEGQIFAYVTGSEIYDVLITIDPLDDARWDGLKAELGGKVENMVDLLGGNLGPGVMAAVTDRENGLFPAPNEIVLNCSCPDPAGLCKHLAAVMYGVGVMLDDLPELLFKLRGVDHRELVAEAVGSVDKIGGLAEGSQDGLLKADDLSELFGIEISEPESAF